MGRRLAGTRWLAAALGAALVLAGCGGGDEAAGGKVTLRFTWWGSDGRHTITQKVIDAFEAEHPNIEIKGEYGDWTGYWDKLSTQVAANDAPDIIQMDEQYIREYAGRGALLDLAKYDVNLDGFDASVAKAGEFDGGLYGVVNGVNAPVVLANPQLFQKAGVKLPDDKTWTWDDYTRIATELTAKSAKGVWGSQSFGSDPAALKIWLRQRGADLYTADGKLGFSAEQLAEFFDQVKQLRDAKAIPTAELIEENAGATVNQSGSATGKYAMGFWNSNQLAQVSEAAGQEFKLLRFPSLTGKPKDAQEYYKASQFWSASARTKHPEEVGQFIDFLANSDKAAQLLLSERGTQPNKKLREATASKLSPTDQVINRFISDLAPDLGAPTPPVPVGLGGAGFPLGESTGEVLFGRLSSLDAARKLIDEANNNME
ncbi:carbohydrate ABC transporter substrate-binding protein (CUT1 family) [Kribbella amoyensis]|uniref:Carbohydrate ABC transporter substrate-binding protein (CUT1 family) n=1 Tax=Kribbella amoyensis TaxID=996641 RepID=A0A561BM78_9ACTN|nr:extracellular solute-binding protein [Kribbella amoyensis]TWD79981.1 carbohydrate ABC transporter substrate-binding protein (CUT1 family) [Kribbella amoyensis]